MTQTLANYANGVPDDLTLGNIVWYSISDPKITYEEMVQIALKSNIDLDLLPKRVAPSDAFRRACKTIDRKDKKAIPWNGNETFYTFMVRHILDNVKEVERHLVFETIDRNGRKLDHQEVAKLHFDKGTSKLTPESLVDPVTDPELETLVQQQLTDLLSLYAWNASHIDAQGLRHAVRQQLALIKAIQVRPRGGVYFVPVSETVGVQALTKFVGFLGEDSAFHALPLMDTSNQRNMIRSTFETSIHEESLNLINELREVKSTGKKLTKGQWEKMRKRFNHLTKNTNTYSELVEDEMDKARTELTALHQNIMSVLENDLVK